MVADIVFISMGAMAGLGATFGAVLSVASRKLAVPVDPRVDAIKDVLPGAGCGGCGFAGCGVFAKALVAGRTTANACAPGGSEVVSAVSSILGVAADVSEPNLARVACAACRDDQRLGRYQGFADCNAALTIAGGGTSCAYACLGLGTCARACPFHAIVMDEETGLPFIIEERCTGCGACLRACPRGVLTLLPRSQPIMVACHNPLRGPEVKKTCALGCIGCTLCVKACPEEVDGQKPIRMNGFLPEFASALCNGCGACLEKCPTHSLVRLQPRRLVAPAEVGNVAVLTQE